MVRGHYIARVKIHNSKRYSEQVKYNMRHYLENVQITENLLHLVQFIGKFEPGLCDISDEL